MKDAQVVAVAGDAVLDEDLTNRSVRPVLRLVHYLIDSVAIFVLYFVLTLMLLMSSDAQTIDTLPSVLILSGAGFGYYLVMESRFQKTLGKFLTKTHVVNTDGSVCNTTQILVRTFCRFIPFDNLAFLFRMGGFHDNFSKTTVIHD